ncbi:hypothetical protein P8Q88_14365 [Qipengyuania sp. XHP0207]|uniref:hypothetical protein n=1 Tax=Qipengyuania sp. XHP0207 TaxID=3038078 RepID=UPI002420421D|nr:hypothetical protein [Qipengyuania sp. XHP0207]MDG5749359.1 hypothetical protein [Qipengyuania sp. XHP0207]
MTDFEFAFILYALLLGLSLIELLAGLGRALELKFASNAGGATFTIGWLTPALAIFVMLDLLSFWIFAWRLQDQIAVDALSLLAVMVFASSYYLAARLVFPSEPDRFADLDTHYFRVKKVVMAILIALVFVQWGYLLTVPGLRDSLFSPLSLVATGVLVGLMAAVAFIRSATLNLILLGLLIVRYLVIYAI